MTDHKADPKMIRVPLENKVNSQYLAQMHFGSPVSQTATVVFDTGSNWLTVSSNLCKNCTKKAFDLKKSYTAVDT